METTQQQLCLSMEILEIIPVKLPAKSLLRFQTLSKAYMAKIRNPSFIRKQLEQSRKNHRSNSFLVRRKDNDSRCFFADFVDRNFRLEKEIIGNYEEPPLSYLLDLDDDYPMCFCDDRVLFIHRSRARWNREEKYILWYPINNNHREIRCPFFETVRNFGICHDQTEDDYKIVLVFEEEEYTVHSCKNGTWAEMKKYDHLSLRFTNIIPGGVFADRRLYWFGFKAAAGYGIIYFDPTCDGLKEIESPEDFRRPFLVNLRGLLCIYGDLKREDLIQFWTLREGTTSSWELTICIDKSLNRFTSLRWNVGYRCYMMGDEIVIFFSDRNKYMIYDAIEDRIVQCCETSLERLGFVPSPRDLVLSLASFFTPQLDSTTTNDLEL